MLAKDVPQIQSPPRISSRSAMQLQELWCAEGLVMEPVLGSHFEPAAMELWELPFLWLLSRWLGWGLSDPFEFILPWDI